MISELLHNMLIWYFFIYKKKIKNLVIQIVEVWIKEKHWIYILLSKNSTEVWNIRAYLAFINRNKIKKSVFQYLPHFLGCSIIDKLKSNKNWQRKLKLN